MWDGLRQTTYGLNGVVGGSVDLKVPWKFTANGVWSTAEGSDWQHTAIVAKLWWLGGGGSGAASAPPMMACGWLPPTQLRLWVAGLR